MDMKVTKCTAASVALAGTLFFSCQLTQTPEPRTATGILDFPEMVPFDPAYSSNLTEVFGTGLFEIKPERRRSWDLDDAGEPIYPPTDPPQPLFPFPIVRTYDTRLLARAERLPDLRDGPVLDWVNTGIRGVGPALSVSSYSGRQGAHSEILLGTQASGLYYKRQANEFPPRRFRKLEFPEQSIQAVLINPADPRHFMVLSRPTLQRVPSRLYQSCDRGRTWGASSPLSVEHQGVDYSIMAREMRLVGNSLTIVGIDTDKEKTILVAARAQCIAAALGGGRRQVIVSPLRKVEVFDGSRSGHLKMDGSFGLLSVRTGDADTLYKSEDGGGTWEELLTLDGTYWFGAYASHSDGGVIMAYLMPRIRRAWAHKFIRTEDGGPLWDDVFVQSVTTSLPNSDPETYTRAADGARFFRFDVQDMFLREGPPDVVGIFRYMKGYLHSDDGGATFHQEISAVRDVRYLETVRNQAEVVAITPVDLRGDVMVPEPGGAQRVLLPTDQGIFELRTDNGRLRNIGPSLHLTEGRGIAVTACPRIYTGLWHVGAYWINPNGSVRGFNGSESDGFGVGVDAGHSCQIPAYSLAHGFLPTGQIVDREVSDDLGDAARDLFGWPYPGFPKYAAGGWWYLGLEKQPGNQPDKWALYSIDTEEGTFTPAFPNDDQARETRALGVDIPNGHNPMYVVDDLRNLYRFTSDDGWEHLLDFDEPLPGGGDPDPQDQLPGMQKDLAAGGDTVVWYGKNGLLASTDGGQSFRPAFVGRNVDAVAVDGCERIYAALTPTPDEDGGVYWSPRGGVAFVKLGSKDARSFVRGLAIDEARGSVYASTYGESLLRHAVPACD